jgi:hypothetical protein
MMGKSNMTQNKLTLEQYFNQIRGSYDEEIINASIFEIMVSDFMYQLRNGYSTQLIFSYNGENMILKDLDEQNMLLTHLINYYNSLNRITACKTIQFIRESINRVN